MKLTRIVHLLFIIFISFGLLLIPGCAKKEEKEKEITNKESLLQSSIQSGGIYRVPLMNNPTTLDPAYAQDIYAISVIHQLFDCLVRFDHYLTVLPALAETWKVEEGGKVYRFILRENIRFHNGKPVTVEDVIFSIGRLLLVDPSPAPLPHLLKISGAQAYREHKTDRIKGLEPIDDRVLLVRLEEPHAPFLTAMGMYQAAIVPKEEVNRLENKFGQNPIGSGPFRFVSWERNKSIHLERFPAYYAGESFLKKIYFLLYPGGKIDDALADFKAGKLQEMPVYGNIQQELSSQSELQWFHRPSLSLLFYGIRGNHPLLKHPEVRKALSLSIDRE
ncbi:MAG TPA: ABC transporter substrate-binding protein, partial [Deltaproteobacteria bacterium]|nr:ABC transporter substrate-binding protein [Deltaproteobacteria bacterium]